MTHFERHNDETGTKTLFSIKRKYPGQVGAENTICVCLR